MTLVRLVNKLVGNSFLCGLANKLISNSLLGGLTNDCWRRHLRSFLLVASPSSNTSFANERIALVARSDCQDKLVVVPNQKPSLAAEPLRAPVQSVEVRWKLKSGLV